MSSGPVPPNKDPRETLRQANEIFKALSDTLRIRVAKLRKSLTLNPTQCLALVQTATTQAVCFEHLWNLYQDPKVGRETVRQLACIPHDDKSAGLVGRLIVAIDELKKIPLPEKVLPVIVRTVAQAAANHWRELMFSGPNEANIFLNFGKVLAYASFYGHLPKVEMFNPDDILFAKVIIERSSEDPGNEYINFIRCRDIGAFRNPEALEIYYAEHRFIFADTELATPFSRRNDPWASAIFWQAIGRALASKSSTLTLASATKLIDTLSSEKLRSEFKGYLAKIYYRARLRDQDIPVVESALRELAELDSENLPGAKACLNFLRKLSATNISPTTSARGLRALAEILKDNPSAEQLEILYQFQGGKDLESLERGIFGGKLRALARTTRDRPLPEIVDELRHAHEHGLSAPDEGVILSVASIVKCILEPDAESPTLDQPDYSDRFFIAYGRWARSWCRENFGFAPNASQLFALATGIKQMEICTRNGGRGAWVELATGEGKSLVLALIAGFLHLNGKTVTVTAPNTYLSQRDAELFTPFFQQLGARTLTLQAFSDPHAVTDNGFVLYATVKELVYDRIASIGDNKPPLKGARLDALLLDEVDALLIDHGVQQHWLTRALPGLHQSPQEYEPQYWRTLYDKRAELGDDPLASAVFLAEVNQAVFGKTDPVILSFQATSATTCDRLKLAEDFALEKGHIVLIDRVETDRLLPSTVWIHGLHELMAIKFGVHKVYRSEIIGTGTPYQVVHQFRQLFCCSGTIGNQSERNELNRLYGLIGTHIPVNNPSLRRDEPTIVYRTDDELTAAIADKLKEVHATKRPILLVASSIRNAIKLRRLAPGKYQLLTDLRNYNSDKEKALEASVISMAGRAGAITVATAMVGRGTDIKLDDDALTAGGLCVVVCGIPPLQRGEAQIRRRAARQGQPGSSIVMTSLQSDKFLNELPKDVFKIISDQIGSPDYTPGSPGLAQLLDFVRNAQTLLKSTKRQMIISHQDQIDSAIARYVQATYPKIFPPQISDLTMFPGRVAELLIDHQIRNGKHRVTDAYKYADTEQFLELGRLFTVAFDKGSPPLDGGHDLDPGSQIFQSYCMRLSLLLGSEKLLAEEVFFKSLVAYREAFMTKVAEGRSLKFGEWGAS